MVSDEVFRQLRSAVATLHAAGIAHNDLHRSNILVSGGMPMVVDFASALLMPAWLARSPLGRQLRRSDLANVVKLQSRLTGKIGRAHVCTPVTNAHLVCRLLLEKKNTQQQDRQQRLTN